MARSRPATQAPSFGHAFRPPATIITPPTTTRAPPTHSGKRSRLVVSTPMLVSATLMPCLSCRGTGTMKAAIPKANTTKPTQNSGLIKAPMLSYFSDARWVHADAKAVTPPGQRRLTYCPRPLDGRGRVNHVGHLAAVIFHGVAGLHQDAFALFRRQGGVDAAHHGHNSRGNR